MAHTLRLACPECRGPLEPAGPEERFCPADGARFPRVDAIWRLLPRGAEERFDRFTREYEAIRSAEGRASEDAAFYLALPFEDRSGRFRRDWRIRARSYRSLVADVLQPFEQERGRGLRVLDLGSGNGWLAHRLALRGHAVAAVDLLVNEEDGLGAHVRHRRAVIYPDGAGVTAVQAEFDRLPFCPGDADVVIYNGSLHYSTDYGTTLGEALRVLDGAGRLVVMDSPVYRNAASGAAMLRERHEDFERRYGFRSDALPSEGFLTFERIEELAGMLGVEFKIIEPWYGVRWALRRVRARVLGRREPARFLVLTARPGRAAT